MIKTVTGSDEILVSKYGYHEILKAVLTLVHTNLMEKVEKASQIVQTFFLYLTHIEGLSWRKYVNSYVKEIEAQIKMLKKKKRS